MWTKHWAVGLALIVGVAAVHGVSAQRQARPDSGGGRDGSRRPAASYTSMVEDFEGQLDPNKWLALNDLDGEVNGTYFWGIRDIRASQGQHSFWAVGDGAEGKNLKAGDNYPSGARSSATLQLDLTKWTSPAQLDLVVDFWLNTRTYDEEGVVPDGLFISTWITNTNGVRVRAVLKAVTAEYPDRFWQEPLVIDLLAAKEIYPPYQEFHLSGQVVQFEFLFKTKDPPGTTLPEGLFIDNIRIVSDVPPEGGAPTSTPGAGPTATSVVTPPPGPSNTPAPGPSMTPEPIESPTAGPTPLPTNPGQASATPEASPTPDGGTPVALPWSLYIPIVQQ